MLVIKGGTIHDGVTRYPYQGDILIDKGRIARVSPNIEQEGAEVVDAAGLDVYPGLVDAASRLGLGVTPTECKLSGACTPHVRALDGVDLLDAQIADAVAGGVTTACAVPWFGNVLDGWSVVYKAHGRSIDDAVLEPEALMEGTLVDGAWMEGAAELREALFGARFYVRHVDAAREPVSKKSDEVKVDAGKMPPFDIRAHALMPVVRGEKRLRVAALSATPLLTGQRVAREFGLRAVLHWREAGTAASDAGIAAEAGVIASAGAPVSVSLPAELAQAGAADGAAWRAPVALVDAGATVVIATGASAPAGGLAECGALAVAGGMGRFEALKAVTVNAARLLGVEGRVGTLQHGRDADVLLVDGDLFERGHRIEAVYCQGERVR